MAFSSSRWHVGTIVARVRASATISAARLDDASRATRKLDVLRIADGVDAGRVSNEAAVAAFIQITKDVEVGAATALRPALGT